MILITLIACMLYGEPGRYMKTQVKEYAMNNETCRQKLLLK